MACSKMQETVYFEPKNTLNFQVRACLPFHFWTLSLHEKVGSVPMYRHFVVSVSPGLVAFVGFLGRALCFVADFALDVVEALGVRC